MNAGIRPEALVKKVKEVKGFAAHYAKNKEEGIRPEALLKM